VFDTVPGDTSARAATSMMRGRPALGGGSGIATLPPKDHGSISIRWTGMKNLLGSE
jgi:hypothetical protein